MKQLYVAYAYHSGPVTGDAANDDFGSRGGSDFVGSDRRPKNKTISPAVHRCGASNRKCESLSDESLSDLFQYSASIECVESSGSSTSLALLMAIVRLVWHGPGAEP